MCVSERDGGERNSTTQRAGMLRGRLERDKTDVRRLQ